MFAIQNPKMQQKLKNAQLKSAEKKAERAEINEKKALTKLDVMEKHVKTQNQQMKIHDRLGHQEKLVEEHSKQKAINLVKLVKKVNKKRKAMEK